MKKISILALTLILTVAMLTACRSGNGNDTSDATQMTTTAPTTRATTAPTTRPATIPSTTQMPTDPQNTTIGPDGTVGTDPTTNNGTEPAGPGTNSTDTTGDMAGRARSGMRNATRSSRRF